MNDVTDIPAVKAPREARQDTCLHCTVMATIERWYEQHGKRGAGGEVVIDVTEVISKLSECVVEIINMTASRQDRRRAMRFAHDALDAQQKSAATGKLVAVDIPPEH